MADTKTEASPTKSSNPPPGCADGGQWGENTYIGAMTCVGCLFVGCLIFCCPCDKRDAYAVDGKVYDAAGACLGNIGTVKFIPKRT